MQESPYFEPLDGGRFGCTLCPHGCVLSEGDRGVCGVRGVRGGRPLSLVGDRVVALQEDPVEKKPLYHALPGTRTLSYATVGCNLVCTWCQNHAISQCRREPLPGRPTPPEALVARAREAGCPSITATYTEPTVYFELAAAVGRAAREAGLLNFWVSNGFMAEAPRRELVTWLDAVNIDLKAMREETYRDLCGGRLAPVLETIETLVAAGVWVEVTTLLIPGVNDADAELKALAGWLAGLSPALPWHVSAFHPDHRMLDRRGTPVTSLVRAGELGREAGLHHVYLGNARVAGWQHTRCAGCGKVVIRREGRAVVDLVGGKACPECGRALEGVLAGW